MGVWTNHPEHQVVFGSMGRVYLPMARTWACEYALAEGFDYLLWLDDDAIIDPNDLFRLLAHNKEFVAAPYPMRPATELMIDSATLQVVAPPVRTGIRTLRPDPTGKEINETLGLDELNQGLVQIAGAGFHCTLMKTSVLTTTYNDEPTLQQEATGDYQDSMAARGASSSNALPRIPYIYFPYVGGEDLCLCTRLRHKGFTLYCDTDLWADHVVGTAILRRPGLGTHPSPPQAPSPGPGSGNPPTAAEGVGK
jgi:hypothetical protein